VVHERSGRRSAARLTIVLPATDGTSVTTSAPGRTTELFTMPDADQATGSARTTTRSFPDWRTGSGVGKDFTEGRTAMEWLGTCTTSGGISLASRHVMAVPGLTSSAGE